MRCKICGTIMQSDDLIVDENICLDCIDDTDGGLEDTHKTLHKTTTHRGTVHMYEHGGSFYVTETFMDYGAEREHNITSRHDQVELATVRYENVLRKLL